MYKIKYLIKSSHMLRDYCAARGAEGVLALPPHTGKVCGGVDYPLAFRFSLQIQQVCCGHIKVILQVFCR